jgi:uncharacterized membrane protein YeaQ/YmgE (transglycosylase-associated protein family)
MKRLAINVAVTSLLVVATGCMRSPDFNILGSYFPAWIFCIVAGIIAAALARLVFRRFNFEHQLRPLALIYSCLACFFACTLWLLFFN